jgi:hypothetical protein
MIARRGVARPAQALDDGCAGPVPIAPGDPMSSRASATPRCTDRIRAPGASGRPPVAAAEPAQAAILALQGSVGNAAVARLLTEPGATPTRVPTVRIQRMWSLTEFETQVTKDTAIRDEHKAAVAKVRLALTAYLADPSDDALEKLAKAQEKLPKGNLRKGLKGELVKIYREMMGTTDDEPKAEDVIDDRLSKNAFRVTSTMDVYEDSFPGGFREALAMLTAEDRWLEGGAGEALAMREYLTKGPASGVGFSFKRPEKEDLSTFQKDHEKTFKYVEGDFAKIEGELDETGKGFKLITDHNGVLMYTRTLSEDLERYLRYLLPGGRMFFVLIPVDTVIDGKASAEAVVVGLEAIMGARLASRKGAHGWELERTADEVTVPALKSTAYEVTESSNAPHRTFTWK